MKKRINIAEILKDCPQGLKLYSPIFGNVYLNGIRPHLAVIVKTPDNKKEEFLYDGRFGINGECMLFPSKENRDWSTFKRPFKQFRDGDVVTCGSNDNFVTFIYKEGINMSLVKSHFVLYSQNMGFCKNSCISIKEDEIVFATEEEKEELFKAIKEHGYNWNTETKTLEKLQGFKVGDRIKHISSSRSGIIVKMDDKGYYVDYSKGSGVVFVSFTLEKNYELAPNKFDISTLIPFESKVLVRNKDNETWAGQFYSHYDKYSDIPFICIGVIELSGYKQCIPYNEETKHLLGTTNDCMEYYKTWE